MRCEEAWNQLNARADGELPLEDAAALKSHLAECANCRDAAQSLSSMDADLRRGFAKQRETAARLADRVVAMLPAAEARSEPSVPTQVVSPPVVVTRFSWGHALLAVAAGFLLAVALFQPWGQDVEEAAELSLKPVARMAAASGPVEVLPATKIEALMCPTGAPIEQDSIVRTGPSAKCEIATPNGNELRLDCNTEVKLRNDDVVEVSRGRLFSSSQPGKKGFEIESGGGRFAAKDAAQWAVTCEPNAVRLIVAEGTVNVQSGDQSLEVGPGKEVCVVGGKVEGDPDACNVLLETAWMNSLLALRSSDHPEFVERVQQLLANVGAAKLSLMYEDELRRLGNSGVPPLLAFLRSTRESSQDTRRVIAARIVADVAASQWIPELISLLVDENAEVRTQAARGLERLTGRDQGLKPESWQLEQWGTCESAQQKWIDWWAKNRDHYPGARREVSAAESPSVTP